MLSAINSKQFTIISRINSQRHNFNATNEIVAKSGNLRGFLPFRIYVKSIFAGFRRSKTAIVTIFEALYFDFWKTFTIENVKNCQKSNSRVFEIAKIVIFKLLQSLKFISRKN